MITDTRADGTGNAMAEVVPDGTDQWSAGAELVGDLLDFLCGCLDLGSQSLGSVNE